MKKLKENSGFIVLVGVMLSIIILTITMGTLNIALKEINFSSTARNTSEASFSADVGVECALYNDKTALNKFPLAGPASSITCLNTSITPTFTAGTNTGTYVFTLPNIGSSGQCAQVTVVKDNTTPPTVTRITAKGYNIGNGSCASSNSNRVERAFEATIGATPTGAPPAPPAPPGTYSLTASLAGTGGGSISSSPSGISCGSDCSENYSSGQVVVLSATPDATSTFSGWSGDADCSDGSVTMSSGKSCTATFAAQASSPSGNWTYQSYKGGIYTDLLYHAASGKWTPDGNAQGSATGYVAASASYMHPGPGGTWEDVAATWTAVNGGAINITVTVVSDEGACGADGILVTVLKNGTVLSSNNYPNGFSQNVINNSTTIVTGDKIYVRLNRISDYSCDGTFMTESISTAASNSPPVANAGPDKAITLPISTSAPTGTSATDSDGSVTSTVWSFVSGPATPTITNGTTLTPSFSGMSLAGTYVFRLTATDNQGATGTDNMQVVVSAAAGQDGTGGTITHVGGYTIHTFTSNGTFNPGASITSVEALVVAGGGSGGGSTAGGGGAGGVISNSNYTVSQQNYSITVGAGGAQAAQQTVGNDGQNSIFATLTAIGGGGGGFGSDGGGGAGRNGGSGGGGAHQYDGSNFGPGTGTAGQGSSGGNFGTNNYPGGGGGGAGGAGSDPTASKSGNGGPGISSSISGSAAFYGGGGGGGSATNGGNGGSGGGGAGTSNGIAGNAGTDNTGGGGGGGWFYSGGSGGAGGSGIVIVRYLTP